MTSQIATRARRALLIVLTGAAVSAPALADADQIPGTYRADNGVAGCRLRLDPPAEAPQDSLVVAEAVSGLVLAFPGCPSGLSEALFWSAPVDGASLALIDGSGAVILAFEPGESRGWQGETVAGAIVTLTPA